MPTDDERVTAILGEITENPRTAKRALAKKIVALYSSETEAEGAESHFDQLFIHKKAPDHIDLFEFDENSMPIIDLLMNLGAAASKSDARRMIQQKSVLVDERKVEEIAECIELCLEPKIIRAGKRRFFKVATRKTF